MNERTYGAGVAKLRSPARVAMLEVDRVVDIVSHGLDGGKLVDVGTGSGLFAQAFAERGFEVAGVDSSEEMVEAAREMVPAATFVVAPGEDIPLESGAFDVAFLGHVLHEADDHVKMLSEAARLAARVAVLEWPKREQEMGPPLDHRLSEDDVRLHAAGAGLEVIETHLLEHMVLYVLA